jgi:thiol-disulfide isomerase/thioredoxin
MKMNIMAIGALMMLVLLASCANNNKNGELPIDDIYDYEPGKVKVYFFWGDTCPHCKTQMEFFERIEPNHPEMELLMFETYRNPGNVQLFRDFAARYAATPRAVPTTFIGDKMWTGYSPAIEREIVEKIEYCKTNECRIPEP